MLHGSLGVLPVFYGRDPLVAEELGGLAHGRGAPPIKEEDTTIKIQIESWIGAGHLRTVEADEIERWRGI